MVEIIMSDFRFLIGLLTLFVVFMSSGYIFLKARKLYKLSSYKGFKIFSLSFLYFTLSAITIFLIKIAKLDISVMISNNLLYILIFLDFILYSLLSLAGLFLAYSLVWKDLEKNRYLIKKEKLSNKFFLLNTLGFSIGLLSLYNKDIMFVTLLIVILYAGILAYHNYKKGTLEDKKSKFAQLYFIAMVLAFVGYFANFLLRFFPYIDYYVYLITNLVFLVFVYGVVKSSRSIKE